MLLHAQPTCQDDDVVSPCTSLQSPTCCLAHRPHASPKTCCSGSPPAVPQMPPPACAAAPPAMHQPPVHASRPQPCCSAVSLPGGPPSGALQPASGCLHGPGQPTAQAAAPALSGAAAGPAPGCSERQPAELRWPHGPAQPPARVQQRGLQAITLAADAAPGDRGPADCGWPLSIVQHWQTCEWKHYWVLAVECCRLTAIQSCTDSTSEQSGPLQALAAAAGDAERVSPALRCWLHGPWPAAVT